MQALKALVIFMAVLILAGLVALAYGLATRGTDGTSQAFGDQSLPVPAGCTIADSQIDGTRMVLRLDGLAERGCQQVLVVDLESGKLLGRLKAKPEK